MKKDNFRFVVNGVTHISHPAIEQKVKRDLFEMYGGDAIVECREYKSGYLYEVLKLKDLFNYGQQGIKREIFH